ncbi:hypothetical protein FB45DRAFT_923046, partial [Roridomyces roridus]
MHNTRQALQCPPQDKAGIPLANQQSLANPGQDVLICNYNGGAGVCGYLSQLGQKLSNGSALCPNVSLPDNSSQTSEISTPTTPSTGTSGAPTSSSPAVDGTVQSSHNPKLSTGAAIVLACGILALLLSAIATMCYLRRRRPIKAVDPETLITPFDAVAIDTRTSGISSKAANLIRAPFQARVPVERESIGHSPPAYV